MTFSSHVTQIELEPPPSKMLVSRVRDEYSQQQPLITKTPGKSAIAHRLGRQENHVQGSATLTGKTQRTTVVVATPLHDKTPFPNRIAPARTPGPQKQLAKSTLSIAHVRPSSTRKNVRTPQSASKSPPNLTTFKTPVMRQLEWDDVGDESLSFERPNAEDLKTDVIVQPVVDEDEDIEYMPPTAICSSHTHRISGANLFRLSLVPDPDYEPPFEMPSYKSLAKGLLAFAQTFPPHEDFGPPAYEYDEQMRVDEWPRFRSSEIGWS
jgi:hypothetical protein